MKLFALALSLLSLTHLSGQLGDLGNMFAGGETYGTNCGFAGTPPESRTLVEGYIKAKDITAIQGWLDSPSLVHQAYAAEAMIRLHNEGVVINEKIITKVGTIKSMDNMIDTCNGCVVGKTSLRRSLSDWKFATL